MRSHAPARRAHEGPEPDIGLEAQVEGGDGGWVLTVSTRRFAQWVVVEGRVSAPMIRGSIWRPEARRPLRSTPKSARNATPAGEVRALNSVKSARFSG